MTIVIAVCAAIGAIAGIAGSAAAPSSSSSKAAPSQAEKKALKRAFALRAHVQVLRARAGKGFPVPLGGPRFAGPGFEFGPVHAEAVIPKPDGSGFVTVTTDSGTLNSAVDGTTLHLKEGTDKATYKDDVPVDVGGSARVMRNGQKATLSDLKPGDHVRVITGPPKGNIVIAEDAATIAKQQEKFKQLKKQFKEQLREHGFRKGGFRFAPAPGGPPPGVPGDFPGPPGSSSGWSTDSNG